MKNKIIILLLVSLVTLSGCSSGSSSNSSVISSDTTIQESITKESIVENVVDEYEGMQDEEITIRKRIKEKYSDTDITSIILNPDLGTDTEDDLIALVNLTWNVQNSGKTSKEMLLMYSNDLAATVANECPNIQEIAIFWDVPYLKDNAKCAYERKDNGMYEMDFVWGNAFN